MHFGLTTYNTKVNQTAKNQLLIFPNPFVDGITISTSGNNSLKQLDIITVNGKHIKSSSINEKTFIDLADLPIGIYLVKIHSDNGDFTSKIIKKSGL